MRLAGAIGGGPDAFDEKRLVDMAIEGQPDRAEPFEVTDLKHQPLAPGHVDQAFGLDRPSPPSAFRSGR